MVNRSTPEANIQLVAQNSEEIDRIYEIATDAVVSIRAGKSTGTGIIISTDGLILTNAHIVDNSRTVTVTLADDRRFEGAVVAHDETGLDLVAIRIQGQNNLPSIRLASPESVQIGQTVHFLQIKENSLDEGSLSRSLTPGTITISIQSLIEYVMIPAIHTDNSHGLLLNREGELIGPSNIRTSGQAHDIGFAVSIERVRGFVASIENIQNPTSTIASPPCATYVEKLGTSSLTSADFEELINCGYEAVPLLRSALNSNNSDVRASAAYALGEIALTLGDEQIISVMEAHGRIESNLDVLRILRSYGVESSCSPLDGCGFSADVYRRQIQSQASASSPIICSLPRIRNIFPRCR